MSSTTFPERLLEITTNGMVSLAMALGRRLNLFDALAETGTSEKPASPKEVADKAQLKERYVREWLGAMACADIIGVTPDEKFWIPEDRVPLLAGPVPALGLTQTCFLPILAKAFDQLVAAFRVDGPYGLKYADFAEFYRIMDGVTQSMHGKHMLTDYLPQIGMKDKLEQGGLCALDVGCGSGFHAALMAETFPNCTFTGIDITLDAIHLANQQRVADGKTLSNLAFIQMDAGHMDADWTGKFDFVTIFDSCHDQMRPDLCLSEIYRVLKPGGLFAMLEVKGTSNIYTDKASQTGPVPTLLYGISMFHCLPVGSNSPDALCLGATWGEGRAREMLKKAGFSDITIQPTPYFPINVVYLARK